MLLKFYFQNKYYKNPKLIHNGTIQRNKAWALSFYTTSTGGYGISKDLLLSPNAKKKWKSNCPTPLASTVYNHLAWIVHRPTLNPALPWSKHVVPITANLQLVPFKDVKQQMALIVFDCKVLRSKVSLHTCSLCGFPLQRGHLWLSCEISLALVEDLVNARVLPPSCTPTDLLLIHPLPQPDAILFSLIAFCLKKIYNLHLDGCASNPLDSFKKFMWQSLSSKPTPHPNMSACCKFLLDNLDHALITITTISHSTTGWGSPEFLFLTTQPLTGTQPSLTLSLSLQSMTFPYRSWGCQNF